jgi:hypothetical protein
MMHNCTAYAYDYFMNIEYNTFLMEHNERQIKKQHNLRIHF